MRTRLCGLILVFVAGLLPLKMAFAQQAQPPVFDPGRELVIGITSAPPFVIKSSDGTLSGISIDLLRRIAEQRKLRFRFVEASSVEELVSSAASGTFDAAIAAIPVSAARARMVDFGQPYLVSHVGIAVPVDGAGAWAALRQMFFSFRFFEAVGLLVVAAILMGLVLWLFERRQEAGYDSKLPGLGTGIWWSAATMTQSGANATPPSSLAGRIFAVSWMIASVVIVAVFTAALSATVTKTSLQGVVQSERDLLTARIGVPDGFAWLTYLTQRNIRPQVFANTDSGFEALRTGKIDAFMNDGPQLKWAASQDLLSPVSILDMSLGEQSLAMISPQGSPLRGLVDLALLDAIESDWWRDIQIIYGARN